VKSLSLLALDGVGHCIHRWKNSTLVLKTTRPCGTIQMLRKKVMQDRQSLVDAIASYETRSCRIMSS
jgi:hypothetical protein